MSDTNISCPKCGAEIPLSEAVSHRLRERLETDFEKQRLELNTALAARERKVDEAQAVLETRTKQFAIELSRQLEVERGKLMADAILQAENRVEVQLKDLQAQISEQDSKLKQAQDNELTLRQQQRSLEEAKSSLDLEVARRIDIERVKIAEQARQQAVEFERLRLADKDNVIRGLQEQIAALQQRAEQGSMQLQGETLELMIENDLRQIFTYDEIIEVKKGQRGADILQRVRTNAAVVCGSILWETKRARNWAADWTDKLKADQREANCELAVIVTTCPPENIRGIGQLDGVWVCEPAFAPALAAALRQGLISTAIQRLQDVNRTDKMQALYDHLCSVGFRHNIEAIVEAFIGLQEQLSTEQRAFARQWKEREQQLQKAITHTAMIYGGIQGIAGREALPEIKSLSMPGVES